MVDTLVLGASAERRGGSSPLIRTKSTNSNSKETPLKNKCFSLAIFGSIKDEQKHVEMGARQ